MKVTLICQGCGKEYQRYPSAASNSHFCSNACRARKSSRLFADDLTGQRFGRWTVKERAFPNGKHDETRWLCECDCGNTAIVYKSSLVSDRSKSCGCWHKEVSATQAAKKFTKLIPKGKQFGRLAVISESGRSNDGQVMYLCQCVCGNKVIVRSTSLRSGNTKSCGCFNIDRIKERSTTHGLTNKPHFSRWRHQVRRNVDSEWTIEMNDALFRLQPKCVICGSTENLSVDHVRPLSKGYGLEPGNAAILCKSCNSKKHDKDLSELPADWQRKIKRAAREFVIAWEEQHDF